MEGIPQQECADALSHFNTNVFGELAGEDRPLAHDVPYPYAVRGVHLTLHGLQYVFNIFHAGNVLVLFARG